MGLYDKGDVIGFAKAAHPLVSVLLHRFLQYDAEESTSVDPNDFKDGDEDYTDDPDGEGTDTD